MSRLHAPRRRADRHQAGQAGAQHGRAAVHRSRPVEARIGLVVLSMGGERLDTRNPTSKLMLTILVGVATDCESHPPLSPMVA